jgi:hypothetical protein
MIGPSPSIPVMPSTIASDGRTAADTSMMLASIPAQCRTFFGQPYTLPGTHPKQFFSESVTPARWWDFIFGIDTTTSASTTGFGSHSSRRSVYRLWSGRRASGATFRSTNGASTSASASRSPAVETTYSVSRRWPGPSPTVTVRAPSRRSASTVAPTRRGSVLMTVPASYST